MASPKNRSKIKRFFGGMGLFEDNKPKVNSVNLSDPFEQGSIPQRQTTTVPIRKTSLPEAVRKRASSVSETVQDTLKSARSTISEPVKGKWTELRAKYSKDMSLSEVTTFILYNPEQAKSFLKKRPTGIFSKRNFHEEYINNIGELYRLYKLDARYTNIRDLIIENFPPRVVSELVLKHEDDRQASITSRNTTSDYDQSITDLDSLSDELKDEKAKREQFPQTTNRPLDDVLNELDAEMSRRSESKESTPIELKQAISESELDEILAPLEREEDASPSFPKTAVDEMEDLFNQLQHESISEKINTRINMRLNELITLPSVISTEANLQVVNEIVEEIKKANANLTQDLNKHFNHFKTVLAAKHAFAMQSNNLAAIEDLQTRYALFNQWTEGLASIPGYEYESLKEHSVNLITLNELQQAIKIAKLPPKEEKDLDQLLKEFTAKDSKQSVDVNAQEEARYESGIGDLDNILGDLKSDKEVDRLIDKGDALVSKWEALHSDNASEKEKRSFVKEYEVYLRELDDVGKDALKVTIAKHAAKMLEIRAALPIKKFNLNYEGDVEADQGSVSDLAAKKAQEMMARQAHKTACLAVLDKIEDVAYRNLLSDAISTSQRKGKLSLPTIEALSDFVEQANLALNSKEGMNAKRHQELITAFQDEAISKLFSTVNMKTTYTSSAQAAKNAKPYEVRPVQPSVTSSSLSPITSAELKAGINRLKHLSHKPQSLSERIETRNSDALLNNNTTLKK